MDKITSLDEFASLFHNNKLCLNLDDFTINYGQSVAYVWVGDRNEYQVCIVL